MSGADLVASLEREIDTLISKYDKLYAEYQELEQRTSTISVYTYPPTAYLSVYNLQIGGFVAKKTPHIRFSGTEISYVVSDANINYATDVAAIVFDPNSAVVSIPVVAACGPTDVHVVRTEDLSGDQAVIQATTVKARYSKCAVFSGYVANNTTFSSTYLHFVFNSPSAVQYVGKTDNIADDEYLIPIQLIIDGYV